MTSTNTIIRTPAFRLAAAIELSKTPVKVVEKPYSNFEWGGFHLSAIADSWKCGKGTVTPVFNRNSIAVDESEIDLFRRALIEVASAMAVMHSAMAIHVSPQEKFTVAVLKAEMVFNSTVYHVTCDTTAVMRFLLTKLRVSSHCDQSRQFDRTYGNLPWGYFQKHVRYKKVKTKRS